MKCAVHSEREAIGACVECGLGFCDECRVSMDNKNYCKKCVDKVAKKGNLANRNPIVAALLSFIIPGTGQIYNGQIGKGFLVFFTSWLILPWIYGVFDAYSVANKINKGEIAIKTSSGCLPVFLFIITVPVCVSIVSLLAAIAIPNLLRARHNANEAGAIAAL
ncbi:MAG: DUF5683 domain-containing protein, partial [Candidatus Zapsychrus exili]|nr:DUF5683 domain-containing protein [Candidatus Zapsychrus exili]